MFEFLKKEGSEKKLAKIIKEVRVASQKELEKTRPEDMDFRMLTQLETNTPRIILIRELLKTRRSERIIF